MKYTHKNVEVQTALLILLLKLKKLIPLTDSDREGAYQSLLEALEMACILIWVVVKREHPDEFT